VAGKIRRPHQPTEDFLETEGTALGRFYEQLLDRSSLTEFYKLFGSLQEAVLPANVFLTGSSVAKSGIRWIRAKARKCEEE
jgi:hypothetical protein